MSVPLPSAEPSAPGSEGSDRPSSPRPLRRPWFDRLWPQGRGDKSPLRPQAGGSGRGALCIHGLSGTPFEVGPLAQALRLEGYTVSAPLLAGHGITLSALAQTTWKDWLASANEALDELVNLTGQPVVAVGFSMGGLLALHLAQNRPEAVAALAVLSPPLRMRRYQIVLAGILDRLFSPRGIRSVAALPKFGGYDVRDPTMQRLNPGNRAVPIAAAHQLFELGAVVRAGLGKVRVPVMVMQGELDKTVPLEDARELIDKLCGTDLLCQRWFPRSGHLLAIDVERDEVAWALVEFLRNCAPALMTAPSKTLHAPHTQ